MGLEIDVLMDNGGEKSVDRLTREMASLPSFLVQSTVSETLGPGRSVIRRVKRNERQMKKEREVYLDDEECLSTGKGLFDS